MAELSEVKLAWGEALHVAWNTCRDEMNRERLFLPRLYATEDKEEYIFRSTVHVLISSWAHFGGVALCSWVAHRYLLFVPSKCLPHWIKSLLLVVLQLLIIVMLFFAAYLMVGEGLWAPVLPSKCCWYLIKEQATLLIGPSEGLWKLHSVKCKCSLKENHY